jgi:hypothetical protein
MDGLSVSPIKPYGDTATLAHILSLPLINYIGKPVDSLLSQLPSGFTDRLFQPIRNRAKGIFQSYGSSGSNSVIVEIYIDNWQHVNFSAGGITKWSMNDAKLETIAFIRVVNDNNCVYGCNHPNYW